MGISNMRGFKQIFLIPTYTYLPTYPTDIRLRESDSYAIIRPSLSY